MEPQHQAGSQADADGVSPDIGALYEEHKDAMYGMARSMLRNEDQHHAEDVVQDVVMSLLPELPTGIRNWEGFLIHAVKMKIYDLWRSAAHKREKLLLEDARPLEEERHGGDDLGLDPAVVIEETHERAATVAEVRAALAELGRREPQAAYAYRQVKELGRTSQAVADELGVSSSRVRQHVMKARNELIKIILEARGGGL
jgi:RNA polymerase sigma factor (sigma-70 family)